VGTVRSGDRPPGDTSATYQPAMDAEVSGTPEDDVASREPWADIEQAGPGEPDARDQAYGQPAAVPPEAAEAAATKADAGQPAASEPSGRELAVRQRTAAAPAAAAASPVARLARLVPAGLLPARLPWRTGQHRSAPAAGPPGPNIGGPAFARITVLPTILVVSWLLVGLPLLLAGVFLPAPALLIAVLVAVALITAVRRVPDNWPRALSHPARGTAGASGPASGVPAWWGLAGTAVVAAGFAAWQLRFSSDTAIVVRDPGAYLQTGYWLAQHGSLPIPESLARFGGAHPGLSFSSTGFFSTGGAVVPGVMSGLPLILTAGFWVHGITTGQVMGPIIGALAVLAFGGLAGRLAGPRWAPAAALVLALTLPEQYTSRAPFAEPLMQVLLFGGLSLVLDALALSGAGGSMKAETMPLARVIPGRVSAAAARFGRRWLRPESWYTPQRAAMALGGLALGLTSLVRIDGLFDVLPGIMFVGVLVVRRHSASAIAFGTGLVTGVGYGLIDGYVVVRPLMDSLRPLPELIGLLAACFALLSLAVVQLLRVAGLGGTLRKAFARRPLRWLPAFGALLVVAALAGLAARPYLQTVRGPATGVTADYVASLQRLESLPVSPGRLYAEDTLYWTIWYVGLPAVLLGFFGAALLLRRCLRAAFSWHDPAGTARMWALPLAIIFWGSAVVLWQPGTVPDQPWASRRLVPLVIPGLILCAIWASAVLRDRARSRGASQTAATLVAGFCIVAMLVPAAATTFGFGLTYSTKTHKLGATAPGLALKRIGHGETGAVQSLCSSLGASASVVIVDATVAQEFSQTIRGTCGVPVASMAGQSETAVEDVISGIDRVGRRPVLLGGQASELQDYGGNPVRVLDLSTEQEPHTLNQPPGALWSAHYVIWMAAPPVGGIGV
jgi:hypothetical protein